MADEDEQGADDDDNAPADDDDEEDKEEEDAVTNNRFSTGKRDRGGAEKVRESGPITDNADDDDADEATGPSAVASPRKMCVAVIASDGWPSIVEPRRRRVVVVVVVGGNAAVAASAAGAGLERSQPDIDRRLPWWSCSRCERARESGEADAEGEDDDDDDDDGEEEGAGSELSLCIDGFLNASPPRPPLSSPSFPPSLPSPPSKGGTKRARLQDARPPAVSPRSTGP